MIIGLDIDDVIYRTSDAVEEVLGDFDVFKEATKMDVMRGDVSILEVRDFWKKNLLDIARRAKLMEGAAEGIKRLRRRHRIILITARGDENYPGSEVMTREMLTRDGVEYDEIVFNGLDKVKDCRENKVGIFIDDSPRNCVRVIRELEIPVIGFKSKVTGGDLEKNGVSSVENWGDLERAILEIESEF